MARHDKQPWPYQGIVIDSHVPDDGDELTVAVFFYLEVPTDFLHMAAVARGLQDVFMWDARHGGGGVDYLLAPAKSEFASVPKHSECPRVIYYKPSDLIVVKAFDQKFLDERERKRSRFDR